MKALTVVVGCLVVVGAFGSSSSMSSMDMSSMDSSSMVMASSSSMDMDSSSMAASSPESSMSSAAAMMSSSSMESMDSSMAASTAAAMSSSSMSSMASMAADMSSSSAAATSSGAAVPVGVSFDLSKTPIKGGDSVDVTMGTVSDATVLATIVLVKGEDETTLYEATYPSGQVISVVMPEDPNVQTGCVLRVDTTNSNGDVLDSAECPTCTSATFDIQLGGLAADANAIAEALAGPPSSAASAKVLIFFLQIFLKNGKKATRAQAVAFFNALVIANTTPLQAYNIIANMDGVFDGSTGAPTTAEVNKLNLLIVKILTRVNGVFPVLSRRRSRRLIRALRRFMFGFGFRSASQKAIAQLTQQQQQAALIPDVLRQLRSVAAATAANGGDTNENNLCSVVVTAANLNTDLCGGGAFPHIVRITGSPANNNHRMTVVALNNAEMQASDQILTTTLTLSSAVSPHYALITTPLTVVTQAPNAYTIANTFDSTKGASSADATFKCYQRATSPNNNRDPTGTYSTNNVVENRVSATVVTCQGENADEFRWITLAKAATNAGAGTPAATPVTTPTNPTAAAVTAASSDDDGSSASGIIGGVFGGVGCLLLVLAIAAFVLFKSKGSKNNSANAGYPASDPMYGQANGAYKVPTSTPVYANNGIY